MKIIKTDEEDLKFDNWILENFSSKEDYEQSILEFKGSDFFNIEDGFLGFRFSVKKYFVWAMEMFGIKEILVDREKHSVTYATQDKKLIIEFSYKDYEDKIDSLILKIRDRYNGGNFTNTYRKFNTLIQDASEIVADILVEEFPDRYNIRYTRGFNGEISIEVPNVL